MIITAFETFSATVCVWPYCVDVINSTNDDVSRVSISFEDAPIDMIVDSMVMGKNVTARVTGTLKQQFDSDNQINELTLSNVEWVRV